MNAMQTDGIEDMDEDKVVPLDEWDEPTKPYYRVPAKAVCALGQLLGNNTK